MKTAVLWLIGVLAVTVGGVLVNLLSNQIDAWLPLLARRIVRHQATKMGPRSSRCEEEWLAHLDQTHGGLAQLFVALGTVLVPFLTVIENCRDMAQGFDSLAAAAWIQDRASWITVPAVVLLLVAYPPHPSRYAAYAVLIPLLLFCGLYLAPPVRRAFAQGYEWLNYFGRVGVGSLTIPIIGYFVIALSLIPPPRQAPKEAPAVSRGATPPALIFMASLPLDIERRVARASNKTTRVKPHHGVPRAQELLPDKNAPQRNSEPPILQGLESLNLSELPAIPFPEQPIPSSQTFVPIPKPAAPQDIRIIR